MKKFKFTLLAFMAAMMAISFTACSDDDPTPTPDPGINEGDYHFDLFVTVGKHGGMSSKNTTIVTRLILIKYVPTHMPGLTITHSLSYLPTATRIKFFIRN